MDTRIPLKKGTVLNHHQAGFVYEIKKEIARGGSCIVYDAIYRMENGQEKKVKLKECYPFQLNIKRKEDNYLAPENDENGHFEKEKENLRRAFFDGNSLFLTKGLTNATTNMLQCFEENNTVYIPSASLEGNVLTIDTFSNLKDCIQIMITVARVIEQIHQAGYLYLDLKPENIFVIQNAEGKGATELVQLFDFDSLISIEDLRNPEDKIFRLSYTQGYAALEHQMGNFQKLGFFTDVYSIGAVLFYLVFGRVPSAMDCEENAEYNYAESRFGSQKYQDHLFFRLTEFFHHALASYRFDRYQTMEAVIEELKGIYLLADTVIPYVKSTCVIRENRFVGRKTEKEILEKWFYASQENCFFLTGMGGIGKSSFVRQFITAHQEDLYCVLYLFYKGSLQEMIVDDLQVYVNTIERDTDEDVNHYFFRKLRAIGKILYGKKALLVIDDFQGELTKEFQQILQVGWKVLVISRNQPPSCNYNSLELRALSGLEEQSYLFQIYMGAYLEQEDFKYFKKITNCVQGHTLVLELLAKQIRRSKLTLKEASALIEDIGFADGIPERVPHEKDYETKNETIREIISTVFFFHDQGDLKYRILKIVSLFQQSGVSIELICDLFDISSKSDFYDLMEEGWIYIRDHQISLHPVIKEAIEGWEWKNENLFDAKQIMKYLFINLKAEAEKEEYPLPLLNMNQKLNKLQTKNIQYAKWVEKYTSQGNDIGKIWNKRIGDENAGMPSDFQMVNFLLEMSEGVVISCSKQPELRQDRVYVDLLGLTLLHISLEKENFISKYMKEVICHPMAKNAYVAMRLYKRWVSVCLEQGKLEEAENIINEIKEYVRGCNHYVKAEYHDICGDFHDVRLGGSYCCDNEYHDLENMKREIDKSIFYMKLAHGGRKKELLSEYMLGKTNLLIRSTPEKKHEIEKLLNRVNTVLEKNTQAYSKLRRDYYLTKAFYHTLVNPDKEKAKIFCKLADHIVQATGVPDIERIDLVYVPCANMMAEFQDLDLAETILLEAIELCDQYPELAPYIRKKTVLCRYLLDVEYWKQDLGACQTIVAFIDEQNVKREDYDLSIDIPDEIREYLCTNELEEGKQP